MGEFRKFAIVLSVFALLTFTSCSKGDSSYAPLTPTPTQNADVTGFLYVEMGSEGSAPLMLTITNGYGEQKEVKLIIEFQIPEQDEDGSFSFTGPVSIMGLHEVEAAVEGKVDGNSVTATITVEGFTLSFKGVVEGKNITGTWNLGKGVGPVIVIEGLELRVLPNAELSGTFYAVIAEAEHTPPTLSGNWEVLEAVIDEDTCGLSDYIQDFPYVLMDVFQEGWVFGCSNFFSVEFYGIIYLDGSVVLIGYDYYQEVFFEFEGTLDGDILVGTFEVQGEDCIVTGNVTFQIHPSYVIDGYTVEGDLNINPSTSSKQRFEMETPFGLIDIYTLKEQGVYYTYLGPASEIRVKVKSQGRTLIVDGEEVQLSTKKRYTITSPLMMVYLRNTKYNPDAIAPQCTDKNDRWWIQIRAIGVDIEPDTFE